MTFYKIAHWLDRQFSSPTSSAAEEASPEREAQQTAAADTSRALDRTEAEVRELERRVAVGERELRARGWIPR